MCVALFVAWAWLCVVCCVVRAACGHGVAVCLCDYVGGNGHCLCDTVCASQRLGSGALGVSVCTWLSVQLCARLWEETVSWVHDGVGLCDVIRVCLLVWLRDGECLCAWWVTCPQLCVTVCPLGLSVSLCVTVCETACPPNHLPWSSFDVVVSRAIGRQSHS